MSGLARNRGTPLVWRGIELSTDPSMRRSYRSSDEGELWKVYQYGALGEPTWYARLKIGCHRFDGKGSTAEAALEAAADAARDVETRIRQALRPVERAKK